MVVPSALSSSGRSAPVDIQIRGNGVTINDGLREFVVKRASKLDRLVNRVTDAKLELRSLNNRAGRDLTAAQLTIRSGREVLRAEERATDQMQAVDPAFDKRARRRAAGQETIRVAPIEPDESADIDELDLDEADRVGDLVRTKRFGLKPMNVPEAIEQMELLGHDFFLFHYADEDIPSVVYRRRDGSYGLLIPSGG
jgi:putative sigma-54 modulation protein